MLHALDPDVYTVYRAPVDGQYRLQVKPVVEEEPVFNKPRWREPGTIASLLRFPSSTPWPANRKVPIRASVRPAVLGNDGITIEAEPNNSIQQAQVVTLSPGNQDQTIRIAGSADDIEYFDNGDVGETGDDWFKLEYRGTEPRLLTCNLGLTDPFVIARLRFYTADGKEYKEGMNANERVHQQQEEHRTEINRILKPGGVYFVRAEANSPGYELELRVRKPAPYEDPRDAIRQAMYDHVAQVDAWLLNRPRGAAVERRIRDTGSLLGSGCMSCHTQSGVWGVALPMSLGYRLENIHNFRHLVNIMYESLRPTNVLKDAANNTSLPPLDLGDGPAGTRVAGFNVLMAESVLPARKLHSKQQIRTANFVLQSSDPSGINAAGKGSNVGQAVVYRFAGEILREAWKRTGEARYFEALEEKADKMLAVTPKFADDIAHRIEFFRRTFPQDYVSLKGNTQQARNFWNAIQGQIAWDEERLRKSQRPDGAWGFEPGIVDEKPDPAPTALAIAALESLGNGPGDPAIAKGVKWLLAKQDPYGRWNESALTGFVTTAYVLQALPRLYPEQPAALESFVYEGKPDESVSRTVARFRAMAQNNDAKLRPLILAGTQHPNAFVRYWAMVALGVRPHEESVQHLVRGLGDPVKMVREASRWAMRQTLLDDIGWDAIYKAYETGSDLTREQVAAALIMRADAVMPKSRVDFSRLSTMFDRMMNQDANPAVRAWSMRAAWNWWVWNPPVRPALNKAFASRLERPESDVLVENALRYQAQALFIANGQRANGSVDHQYPELTKLFEGLSVRLDSNPPRPLIDRLVAIAGTFYNMSGGDGGPGQMGYVTEHSAPMMGKAVMAYWKNAEEVRDMQRIQLSLEAAANATYQPMQAKLLEYATNGPENLRTIAATSVSDPRVISLPATQEFVEPLMDQIRRGAADPERRDQLSRPVLRLFSRARWNLPKTEEQQRIFYGLLTPKFTYPKGDEKALESEWYLAEQLGALLGSNPDLHTDMLLSLFPAAFANPLEEMFWLPSVPWLIEFGSPVPEVNQPAPSPLFPEVRRRAVALLVKNLSAFVDQRLRDTAIRLSYRTSLRYLPEVQKAVADLNQPEAVRFVRSEFDKDLAAAAGKSLDPGWRRNFDYFVDHVLAEMNTANRNDELSCFGCHGVAGRVPSMELTAPERRTGYFSAKDAWKNYSILLERIGESDVSQSKLLRKPLNVQTGKEDGHQGGRRYNPGERGYEVLKRWAEDVARLRNVR